MADRTVTVRLRALTSDFTAPMLQASAATRAAATQMGQHARTAAQFARTHEAALTTVGTAAMGVGTAMVAAAGLSARANIQWESSFAGVRKTVDGTEAELQGIASGFRQMAKEIPTNVNELNRIGEAAGQLGIQTNSILGFSRTMADLGETTNLSSEQAATSLARLANITQMPQTQFDRLGSTIVELGNNLATTESEIVGMGLRIAGAGNQIGLAEAEVLAIAGALSSVGIEAEAGGSAISRVMIEIASQVATSGEKLGDFAAVAGMSAEQFAVAWQEDAAEALVAFISGLGNMEEQGGSTLQTLEALGITEIRMRDALLRSAGAGDLLSDSIGMANQAWADNNALTEEASQRYETAESRLRVALNTLNDLAIDVGAGVVPALVGLAETGAGAVEWISRLPDPVKAVGGAATGAAGGIVFLGGATAFLLPKLARVGEGLGTLRTGLAGIGITGRSVAGFLAGPWGIALAGAAVAIGGAAQAQHRLNQASDFYLGLLEQEASLLDVTSRRAIADRLLAQHDLLPLLEETGLRLSDIVGTLLGEEEATRRVSAALDEQSRAVTLNTQGVDGQERTITRRSRAGEILLQILGWEGVALDGAREKHEALGDAMAGDLPVLDSWASNLDELREKHRLAADEAEGGMAGLDGWARAALAARDAARGAGEETDRYAEEIEGAATALDVLTDAQMTAVRTISQGFDPMVRYNELLERRRDRAREAAQEEASAQTEGAQATFDATRKRIDAELESGAISEETARRRIEAAEAARDGEVRAAEESRDATLDHIETITASWDDYIQALDDQLTAQRDWHANLNTIRQAAGDEYADMLAAQGPEFAELHAEIAAQEASEIQAAADAALTIRDEALTAAVERAIRGGVELTDATGEWSAATVQALADELGVTPATIESILDDSKVAAETKWGEIIKQAAEKAGATAKAIADELGVTPANAEEIFGDLDTVTASKLIELGTTAGKGAFDVATALVTEYGLGAEDVDEVIKDWVELTMEGVNPVLVAIGKEPRVVAPPRSYSYNQSRRIAGGRHEGGWIDDTPGSRLGRSGPLWPDERLFVGQTGERVLSREEVRALGGVRGIEALLNVRPGMESHEVGGPAGAGRGPATWNRIVGALGQSGLPHRVTSTVRGGNPRSYHAPPGHAVDVAGRVPYPSPVGKADMLAINRWWAQRYGANTAELIHTGAGAVNLYHGRPHTYNPATQRQHLNHVHIAMLAAAGMLPMGPAGVAGFSLDVPAIPDALADLGIYGEATGDYLADVRDQIEDWFIESFVSAGGMAAPDQVRRWVAEGARLAGVPDSWIPGLITIAMRESGGNPLAQNNWDINAARGIPSKGLMQTIGPTFATHHVPGFGDIWNPVHNVAAAARYILARYGDISKVQQANPNLPPRGYADGGIVDEMVVGVGASSGRTYTFGERGPEMVTPMGGDRIAFTGADATPVNITLSIDGKRFAEATGEFTREEMRRLEVSLA